MKAIITGDIINSRAVAPEKWMKLLKEVLNSYGKEPNQWEIFRGDSFQVKIESEIALHVAVLLKSTIKQFKKLDVRIAIGLGEVEYNSSKITESNGSAFVRSGECFETLKKENLAISSPSKHFDKTINLMLSLASLAMNSWTSSSSEIIKLSLENPSMMQSEIAKLLNKSQSNISIGLKRGGFDEIQKLLNYYKEEVTKL